MATSKAKKVTKKVKSSKKVAESTKKRTTKKSKQPVEKKVVSPKFYDQLKLSESYVSLVLGVLVVGVIFLVGFALIYNSRGEVEEQRVLNSKTTPTPEPYVEKHIMLENESLWDVAVSFYGDGFAWVKIVEANPEVITNPDYVPPGTEIIIPEIN